MRIIERQISARKAHHRLLFFLCMQLLPSLLMLQQAGAQTITADGLNSPCTGVTHYYYFTPLDINDAACNQITWTIPPTGNPVTSIQGNSIAITWNTPGTYSVSGTIPSGCPGTGSTGVVPYGNVTIYQTGTYTLTLSGPSSINYGSTATYTAGGLGSLPGTYTFYVNNVQVQSGSSKTYTTSSSLRYCAEIKVAFSDTNPCSTVNGTPATKNLTINNTPPLAPSIPTVSDEICGPKTLTKSGSPTSNASCPASITWFWQGTNATGQDTSPEAAASTYTAPTSATYYIRGRDNSSLVWGPATPVTVVIDCKINWTETIGYTFNGTSSQEAASSRTYLSGTGEVMQQQSKNYTANQVLATQPVKDRNGNPSLQTLPAPINSSSFNYKDYFISAGTDNHRYKANDFDLPVNNNASGEVNNPKIVTNKGFGTLGWYYSTGNDLEPHTPVSDFPYVRSYTPDGPNPLTSKSAGPDAALRMGSGHESITEKQKFSRGDLMHYFSLQHHFVYPGDVTELGPGFYPVNGDITVQPGTTYTFKIKGRKDSSADGVYMVIWSRSLKKKIAVSTTSLSMTTSHKSLVFTVPMECTDIVLAVQPTLDYTGGFTIDESQLWQNSSTVNPNVHENPLVGYRIISTDPNGKKAVSFVDFEGKTLATATLTGTSTYNNWSYTYYNDMGQVVATVAPNGVNTASTSYPSFATTYKYDHLGRLIQVSSPDEGTSQFVYNLQGQIRFSQNEEQRRSTPQRFSYTNYDHLGRLVESGEYTSRTDVAGTPYIFQPHTTASPASNSVLTVLENIFQRGEDVENVTSSNYTGVSVKLDADRCTDYTLIKYDEQSTELPSGDALHSAQTYLTGQVSKTENANSKTWYSYDEFGQLAWSKQYLNAISASKTVDYTYDFAGNVTEVAYQKDQADAFYHHYTYDADQRLDEVFTSDDGLVQTLHAKYQYYLHGPLKRVELGSTVQGIDYTYTITGALKTINNSDPARDPGGDGQAGPNNAFAPDVFGMNAHYYSGDYAGAAYDPGNIQISYTSQNQFGGALKAVTWRNATHTDKSHAYVYGYDDLYRLTEGKFGDVQTGGTPAFVPLDAFTEKVPSYDKNGNINLLQRRNKDTDLIADYSYAYQGNTNRLTRVNHAGTPLVNYSYNHIGQMVQQTENGRTTKVVYNAYGLVKDVTDVTDGEKAMTSYAYDDMGNRILRTDFDEEGVIESVTMYIHDVSGNVMAVYQKSAENDPFELIELPIYGAGRVGTYKPQVNVSFYEVTDHLGNVRALIGMPDEQTHTTNFELGDAAEDEEEFSNYSATDFDLADHTDASDTYTYAQLLTGGNNAQIGLAKSFKVSPGDKIKVDAYAKYLNLSSASNNLATLGAALTQAFGLSPLDVGEGALAYSALNSYGAFMASGRPNTTAEPKAFVTILVFDANYNLVLENTTWEQVTDDAEHTTGAAKSPHEFITKEMIISQPGYAYVYLSNENPTQVDVYFDDVTITHSHSPVVYGADYYPFGLPMAETEITDEQYRYGYQGQFSEKDTTNGWNQFQLRMYDARFGRWISPDPYNQYYSSYVGMGNNPVSMIDPDGGVAGPGGGLFGRFIPNALCPTCGGWIPGLLGSVGSTALNAGVSIGKNVLSSNSRSVSSIDVMAGMAYDIYDDNGELKGYIVNATITQEETFPTFYGTGDFRGQESLIVSWEESFWIEGHPNYIRNIIFSNGQAVALKHVTYRQNFPKEPTQQITLVEGKEAIRQRVLVNGIGTSSFAEPTLSPRLAISDKHLDVIIDHAMKTHKNLEWKRQAKAIKDVTKQIIRKQLEKEDGTKGFRKFFRKIFK